MKASYKIGVKQQCRTRLREFIRARFDQGKLATARVLCFPGREAIEVQEVYVPLGIAPANIVCLERDRRHFNELNRRGLGVTLLNQTLQEFMDSSQGRRFDIVALDFTGQFGTYENQLYRLGKRQFLDDDAIAFTNFCGARETHACQGYYALARQDKAPMTLRDMTSIIDRWRQAGHSEKALKRILKEYEDRLQGERPFWQESLAEQRGVAIHDGVRTALGQGGSGGLIDILFKDRDRDGSLSEQVREFFAPENQVSPERVRPEMRVLLEKARKAAGKKDDALPGDMMLKLHLEVKAFLREQAKAFARRSKHVRLDVDRVASLLETSLQAFLSEPSVALAAQSYKYVSDRGTPMYADVYHFRRIKHLTFLEELLPRDAGSLTDLFAPLHRLAANKLLALLEKSNRHRAMIGDLLRAEAATPVRQSLGKESELNPTQPAVKRDSASKRAIALGLLLSAPHLTNEDIALSVKAETMQVAAWKAHLTMGTYSSGSTAPLKHLIDSAFDGRRHAEALQISSRLLKREPHSTRLLNNHAVILKCAGRDAEAMETIERALAIDADDPWLLCTQGMLFSESGRLESALEVYSDVLKIQPDYLSAMLGVAGVLQDMQRHDAALARYEAALQLQPDCLDAKRGRAITLSEMNRLADALVQFDVLAERHADDFDVVYNRSVVLMKLDRKEDAAKALRAAVKLDPKRFCAVYNLGWVLLGAGQYEEARSALAKALELEPANEGALINLGVIEHRKQNHDAALTVFSKALRLYPESPLALINRSQVWADAGRMTEALADCGRLLELAPNSTQYLLHRAVLLLRFERAADALRDLDQALIIEPENAMARFGKAAALALLGELDAAIEIFHALIEVDPGDVKSLHGLANCLLDSGRFKQANTTFDAILRLEPENVGALNDKAMTLARLGRIAKSLRYLNKAIALDPSARDAVYNKATVLAQRGDHEQAIVVFDQCLGHHPEDYQALCNRAMSKLMTRDLDGAEQDFVGVLCINPEDSFAETGLRKVKAIREFLAEEMADKRWKAKKIRA